MSRLALARAFASRYRVGLLALAASFAVHAALIGGLPGWGPPEEEEGPFARYTATLAAGEAPAARPAATAVAAPRRPARPRARPVRLPPELLAAAEPVTMPDLPPLAEAPTLLESPPAGTGSQEPPAPVPDRVALAQPAVPLAPPPPEPFPAGALPESLTIDYQLTSSIADARATYRWSRNGDRYTITGEAEATGFFALFIEGRLTQESSGSVTAAGLRPAKFRERKPSGDEEGLNFDWDGHTVTFEKGDEKRTAKLADNTVDWLSMVFQLAHRPPTGESAFDLQVFTQRRMYTFNLKVLGIEEIDIPLGRVRALHLRHEPPEKEKAVDVWLGVDLYNIPVKLRYPVAKNRMTVEQVATRVSGP